MHILYGVVGEGMGHATRSRVVIEHLLARGHHVLVVVSGRAFGFLRDVFAGREGFSVLEIAGLHLRFEGDTLDRSETVRATLREAPAGLRKNLSVYRKVVRTFAADAVFTDFDSFAYLLGKARRLPVVSIDNMQVIDRCTHGAGETDRRSGAFRLAQAAVRVRLPRAYHYLVTSFFFPPVRKKRTTLVPPILRPEIRAARREPGGHVLVYQTTSTNEALLPTLRRLPFDFRVYGMGREGADGNVSLRPFSQEGFVDDLRTARAVIAGGGYSLMGEAVHLGVPMLSVPLRGQFEQELNARYLAKLGYGAWSRDLSETVVRDFLERLDEYEAALATYERRDDALLFAAVDELLERIARGDGPPARLARPSHQVAARTSANAGTS